MSLPGFSVKRPTFISMLFAGIIIIGVIALKMLPVEMIYLRIGLWMGYRKIPVMPE